jgi:hypothetical protein
MLQTEVVERKKDFLFNKLFEIRAVYEIMWKNIVEPGRPHMTIIRVHFSRWTLKVTSAPSEYLILTAFALQYWLLEHASILRNTPQYYGTRLNITLYGHGVF